MDMDHTAPYGGDPEPAGRAAQRLANGVGIAVGVTGLIHLGFGVLSFPGPLRAMASEGLLGAIGGDVERNLAWWFLVAGGFLVITGLTLRWAVRVAGRLPRSLGWGLVVISILGVVLAPASGFWLVLVEGVLLLVADRRLERVASVGADHVAVG